MRANDGRCPASRRGGDEEEAGLGVGDGVARLTLAWQHPSENFGSSARLSFAAGPIITSQQPSERTFAVRT
jgi:hypothetical protein